MATVASARTVTHRFMVQFIGFSRFGIEFDVRRSGLSVPGAAASGTAVLLTAEHRGSEETRSVRRTENVEQRRRERRALGLARTGMILRGSGRRLIRRRRAICAITANLRRTKRRSMLAVGASDEPRHRVRDRARHHLHDDEQPRAPGGGLAVHASHRGETLLPRHQSWCVSTRGRMLTCISYRQCAASRRSRHRSQAMATPRGQFVPHPFFLRNQGVLYGETAGIGGSVPTRGLRQRDPARRQIKKPGDRAWKGKA